MNTNKKTKTTERKKTKTITRKTTNGKGNKKKEKKMAEGILDFKRNEEPTSATKSHTEIS